MMSSVLFATDASYREREFQTTPEDRPLVAHFSANDPQTLLKAAKLVEDRVDAVDINLGCPQRIAHAGHFGSYLLGDADRPLVLDMVKTVSRNINKPLFVKIRLLDTMEDSITLVHQLLKAGACLITIHARYRVNLVGRSGPGARAGAAMLDQVAVIKEAIRSMDKGAFQHVPIIANGNIRCWEDCMANLRETNADGVMSAEGILDDPALFWGQVNERKTLQRNLADAISQEEEGNSSKEAGQIQRDLDRLPLNTPNMPASKPSRLSLAMEYLDLADRHPVKLSSLIFHVRRMCRDELAAYQMSTELASASDLVSVRNVVLQLHDYKTSGSYVFDPEKEKKMAEAVARKKREERKRKDFEARMTRKAKREGKDPQFYLMGSNVTPPTLEDVSHVRTMVTSSPQGETEALTYWRSKWPQHCFAYHLGSGGCQRDRACAFLHCDVQGPEANTTPSWLEENNT